MEPHMDGQRPAKAAGGQAGTALLLTLGFLCVLLMLVLSLAMASHTERRSAACGPALVCSQMVARSAMAEAEARLRLDYSGVRYPADQFYKPSSSSPWAGRRYLASGSSGAVHAGVSEALAVALSGREFTPDATLSGDAGWMPVFSRETRRNGTGLEERTVVVGRYSYVIIDHSGAVDPAAVVSPGTAEADGETLDGNSVTELSLATLGFSDPDAFLPASQFEDVLSGKLLEVEGRWFGWPHLARALNFTQTDMNIARRSLFPYSHDQEQFWRDRNNNGVYEYGELADRLDLLIGPTLSQVYHTFVGPQKDLRSGASAADDCAWLKRLDDNPWFILWKNQAFGGYSEPERTVRARSLVAAQTAANLIDYDDADSDPTICHLREDGQIALGLSSSPFNPAGTERTWALSKIAMRVEADITDSVTTNAVTAGGDPSTVTSIPFTIPDGRIIPTEDFRANVTLLGVNITAWDTRSRPPIYLYDPAIGCALEIGSTTIEPWGALGDAEESNVNINGNPRNYEIPGVLPAGTPITITARYWYHPVDNATKVMSTDWATAETLNTSTTPRKALVLRDGEALPERITLDYNNNCLVHYLEDYVQPTGVWTRIGGEQVEVVTASLQSNQALVLFETIAFASPIVPDYQDMAMVVNLERAGENSTDLSYVETFTLSGKVNLNPNNSELQQFSMVGIVDEADTEIDRDDLALAENSTNEYTSVSGNPALYYCPFKEMTLMMPKGQSSEEIRLGNGTLSLDSGKTYTFISDGTQPIAIYNDRVTDGRAMGQWWIDFGEGSVEVRVAVDGNSYYEIEVPDGSSTTGYEVVTEPEIIEPAADHTDYGNVLRLRAGFQVELYYPWAENAQETYAPRSIEVTYKAVAGTVTGKTMVVMGTKDVPVASLTYTNYDGGTIARTGTYHMDLWEAIDEAFDTTAKQPLVGYTLQEVSILNVTVKDWLGRPCDQVPTSPGRLYTAAASAPSVADGEYHLALTAVDPFLNDRGINAPDFAAYWTVAPSGGTLLPSDETLLTGFGTIAAPYGSGLYAGIEVANTVVRRLGELGRIHSFQPNRSLRLWAGSSADEQGHDAEIMDVFKLGAQTAVAGRVNINTTDADVLKAVLTNALSTNVDAAITEILQRRTGGTVFASVGEFLGGVEELTPGAGTHDAVAERTAVLLAERLTTRPNYFTVIVTGQAIRDAAGVTYVNADGQTVSAMLGELDVAQGGRLLDPVLAEQKLMATVYRDGLTGQVRRVQVSPLLE